MAIYLYAYLFLSTLIFAGIFYFDPSLRCELKNNRWPGKILMFITFVATWPIGLFGKLVEDRDWKKKDSKNQFKIRDKVVVESKGTMTSEGFICCPIKFDATIKKKLRNNWYLCLAKLGKDGSIDANIKVSANNITLREEK